MYCWICQNQIPQFATYGIPPKIGRCPECGGKARLRTLAWYLEKSLAPRLQPGSQVLDIGPNKPFVLNLVQRRFIGDAHYTAMDIRSLRYHNSLQEPHRFLLGDATQIPFPPENFELILCNNVLSFIHEDRKVLREIYRCLKPGGLAIVCVDRRPGPTLTRDEFAARHPEYDSEYCAENATEHFYGDDFGTILEAAGFLPEFLHPFADASDDFLAENGLRRDCEIISARKE